MLITSCEGYMLATWLVTGHVNLDQLPGFCTVKLPFFFCFSILIRCESLSPGHIKVSREFVDIYIKNYTVINKYFGRYLEATQIGFSSKLSLSFRQDIKYLELQEQKSVKRNFDNKSSPTFYSIRNNQLKHCLGLCCRGFPWFKSWAVETLVIGTVDQRKAHPQRGPGYNLQWLFPCIYVALMSSIHNFPFLFWDIKN